MTNESDRIIGALLHRDLYRVNLNITGLCNLLAAQTKLPITVQGIIAWKTRNSIPKNRVAGLLEILGPSSELARHLNGGDAASKEATLRDARIAAIVQQLAVSDDEQIRSVEITLGLDVK